MAKRRQTHSIAVSLTWHLPLTCVSRRLSSASGRIRIPTTSNLIYPEIQSSLWLNQEMKVNMRINNKSHWKGSLRDNCTRSKTHTTQFSGSRQAWHLRRLSCHDMRVTLDTFQPFFQDESIQAKRVKNQGDAQPNPKTNAYHDAVEASRTKTRKVTLEPQESDRVSGFYGEKTTMIWQPLEQERKETQRLMDQKSLSARMSCNLCSAKGNYFWWF